MQTLLAIFALAIMMIIHELGHFLPARYFNMRVTKFSIGFGPTIVHLQPKGSPTVYQVSIIPFLAYVQIAGMNPFEENDPKDTGLYCNASLWARVVTIFGGPLANYLTASIFIFFGLLLGGRSELDTSSMRVTVIPKSQAGEDAPAKIAGFADGDRILSINGKPIQNWDDLRSETSRHPGEKMDVAVERAGSKDPLHLFPVPLSVGEEKGKMLLAPPEVSRPIGAKEAMVFAVTDPPKVVAGLIIGLGRIITGKEKPQLSGPVGMVKETKKVVQRGLGRTLQFIGALSAYLGAFNLLPFPALDGGRLMFLGIELASRRKPDAKLEAKVHAIGLLMLLTLITLVTYGDIFKPR